MHLLRLREELKPETTSSLELWRAAKVNNNIPERSIHAASQKGWIRCLGVLRQAYVFPIKIICATSWDIVTYVQISWTWLVSARNIMDKEMLPLQPTKTMSLPPFSNFGVLHGILPSIKYISFYPSHLALVPTHILLLQSTSLPCLGPRSFGTKSMQISDAPQFTNI